MSEEKQSNKFKVGDEVMISSSSRYYFEDTAHNPRGCVGTIISIVDSVVRVKWDEEITNSYSRRDLDLVGRSIKQPQEETEGRKDDSSKPDMTDIPLEAMWEMGKAFTYGQKKYGKNNYRNGMKVSRQLAAAVRHIYQHLGGETLDPESGAKHLGHAMASLAMAIYNLENNPEMDDRFEKDLKKHGAKSE